MTVTDMTVRVTDMTDIHWTGLKLTFLTQLFLAR